MTGEFGRAGTVFRGYQLPARQTTTKSNRCPYQSASHPSGQFQQFQLFQQFQQLSRQFNFSPPHGQLSFAQRVQKSRIARPGEGQKILPPSQTNIHHSEPHEEDSQSVFGGSSPSQATAHHAGAPLSETNDETVLGDRDSVPVQPASQESNTPPSVDISSPKQEIQSSAKPCKLLVWDEEEKNEMSIRKSTIDVSLDHERDHATETEAKIMMVKMWRVSEELSENWLQAGGIEKGQTDRPDPVSDAAEIVQMFVLGTKHKGLW